jgi:hypothetical protein
VRAGALAALGVRAGRRAGAASREWTLPCCAGPATKASAASGEMMAAVRARGGIPGVMSLQCRSLLSFRRRNTGNRANLCSSQCAPCSEPTAAAACSCAFPSGATGGGVVFLALAAYAGTMYLGALLVVRGREHNPACSLPTTDGCSARRPGAAGDSLCAVGGTGAGRAPCTLVHLT